MNSQVSLIALLVFVAMFMRQAEAHFLSKHAVCVVRGNDGVEGVLNFEQKGAWKVTITGKIKGLSKGNHGFHVHQFGDLSNGCTSTGPHFNPFDVDHGAPYDPIDKRHIGCLGNVEADADGMAEVKISDPLVKLFGPNSVIGRAIVVHAGEDDLGRGNSPDSKTTGNAGGRVGCCIIGVANVTPASYPDKMAALFL